MSRRDDRRFYRLRLPLSDRCVVHVQGRWFPVVEISESGLRMLDPKRELRADAEAERILAEARAAAERIRSDAQAAVEQELRRAQAALRDEAADLALEIAGRKLAETVGEGDRERLIDKFITRIEPAASEASPEGANS